MASHSDQLFSRSTDRMGVHILPTVFLAVFSQLFHYAQAREFCQVEGYWCETGHCCGSGECCTYYYELWWFWLVWFLIVFIIGFCVWQRKRFHPWRDNRCERTCSIQDMFLGRGFNFPDITPVPPCKLPSYSEIGETVSYDTPPPPYNVEAAIPCLGEGPSTSLPAGGNHCPPPHRGLQAITQSLSSLNSTPSPSDAPPSYSQIIGSNTPVFASMPSTEIVSQPRLSTGTQFPEQLQQQLQQQQLQQQQQQQQQQNQNNSGSNTTLNSPSTPGRPVSTTVTQVSGVVATCACGSPLRSPVITPHSRMLPPPVPSSPKTTVVSMTQRPQRFLSPQCSPQRFTTSIVTSSSQSSSCSNSQNSSCVRQSPAVAGTPPCPGTAVRSSPLVDDSQGDDPSNGHTVVDMRTNSRRGLGFLSRWRHLR